METHEVKSLAPLFDEICELNRFYKWKLEITYTPKQSSVVKSSIDITKRKDTFSGCILRKITGLKDMQKWNISYYLKARDNKISLHIFI